MQTESRTRFKGTLMLLLAAFFWGTTFVAQTVASDSLGTFTYNGCRSMVGVFFLMAVIFVRSLLSGKRTKKGQNIGTTVSSEEKNQTLKRLWKGGILCGCVLFFSTNLQQSGIAAYPDGVPSSGRAGFLTATYVVMVAITERFFGKKLQKIVWASVLVCLCGMYLLCMSGGINGIYFGDLLLLLCAVCFTVYIIVVDRFRDCDSVKLSCIQFLTNSILSFAGMAIFENPSWSQILAAALPILYAGIFSSGIAYTLQLAGQKYAAPSVAAVVMSLESVFAVLGGFVLLHEVLSPREIAGCALVFAAVIMAQIPQMKGNSKIDGM